MKVSEIYGKTMKFVWLKLALGAAVTGIALVLLAICMGLGSLFGGGGLYIMFLIWLVLVGGVYKLAMNYAGYMLKAAHVAVITTAVTTGQIPDDMVESGKNMVKERFGTTNVYFVLDQMISGAVKQLQKIVGKVDDIFGNIPGVSTVVSFVQTFIGIALGYVDECCLGWTFLRKDESAFKAGCDGVVIYFQNAKHLLKNAIVTTLIVMVATFASWVIPFVIALAIVGVFQIGAVGTFVAIFIAILIAAVIKTAFIDSYMLVKMMVSYMEVAPQTEITFDLYEKLCRLSGKFKALFNKAQSETQNVLN